MRWPLILFFLTVFLSFAQDPAPPAAPPPPQGATAPTDLALRAGETLVKTVAADQPGVPPAYVIKTAEGKVIISWKGARTVPYDAIAKRPETDQDLIEFKEGGLLFRVVQGGRAYFTVQVMERPDTGVLYLMADAETMSLTIVVGEHDVRCLRIITTLPPKAAYGEGYIVEPPGEVAGFMVFNVPPVKGNPDHLTLIDNDRLLLFSISQDGRRVETWVQPMR